MCCYIKYINFIWVNGKFLDDFPNRDLKIPKLEGEVTDMLYRQSKAWNFEKKIPDNWKKTVIVLMPKKVIQLHSIISEESVKVVIVLAGQPLNS